MAAVVGVAGIELAALVGLGAWLGQWLDARLTPEPAGMIVGIVTGAVLGFWVLVRVLGMARQKR